MKNNVSKRVSLDHFEFQNPAVLTSLRRTTANPRRTDAMPTSGNMSLIFCVFHVCVCIDCVFAPGLYRSGELKVSKGGILLTGTDLCINRND